MFKKLTKWSLEEFPHLPWRKKRTLYRTLVSEIMLQQTTVSTVLGHFERFCREYPTISSLAKTTEDEIIMSWKGLGYYRRARNLRAAAIYIEKNFKGKIPRKFEELVLIDGIGEYTANALLSIGMDRVALPVDANVERILSRYYGLKEKKGPKLQKQIKELFLQGEILPKLDQLSPRHVAEAIMDLGRTFCQANKVDCSSCPMSKKCYAYQEGNPLSYPKGAKETKVKPLDLHLLRVLVIKNNQVIAYKKSSQEWLSSQLELPTFIVSSGDKKLTQYPWWSEESLPGKKLFEMRSTITKYKIKNTVVCLKDEEFQGLNIDFSKYKLFTKDYKKTNFAATTMKILKKLD